MLTSFALAALMTSAPEGSVAPSPMIDEQLQCVLRDYSDEQQSEFDAWADAYEFATKMEKPANFIVSLARSERCREELSWTSMQETAAAFHATFLLEEKAANAAKPKARDNVVAFYASLDEEEAQAMERALAFIASGVVNAVGDDAEPGMEVLFANYALNEKMTEKLPDISQDDRGDLTHLLITGTLKDLSRQMFEVETLGEQPKQGENEAIPEAPTSGPPPERQETIPTPQRDR